MTEQQSNYLNHMHQEQPINIHLVLSDTNNNDVTNTDALRSFLVRIKEEIRPTKGQLYFGVVPETITKYRTLTIKAVSFTAAQQLVVSKGFTLAD